MAAAGTIRHWAKKVFVKKILSVCFRCGHAVCTPKARVLISYKRTLRRKSISILLAQGLGFAVAVIFVCLSPVRAHAGTIQGKVQTVGDIGLPEAVVYIDKISNLRFLPPKQPLIINQVNLQFRPRIAPILAGTVVGFQNSDPLRHNVFSPSPVRRFNLGTYPYGLTRYVTFDKPGEVEVLCNIHQNMHSRILILETPYFCVTDSEGRYLLNDVPKGSYTIVVWHEAFPPHSQPSRLDEEQNLVLNFSLHKQY